GPGLGSRGDRGHAMTSRAAVRTEPRPKQMSRALAAGESPRRWGMVTRRAFTRASIGPIFRTELRTHRNGNHQHPDPQADPGRRVASRRDRRMDHGPAARSTGRAAWTAGRTEPA